MKTSTTIPNKIIPPSLFQLAANLETGIPMHVPQPAFPPGLTPPADLSLHPIKKSPGLKAAQNYPAKPGQENSRHPASAKGGGGGGAGAGKPSRKSLVETEFYLEAPRAKSVKLAADFTDWDKSPLDLAREEDGIWQVVVSLPPGDHAYRFIVDGQWCDDPRPALRVPNPFGTANTIMRVI